MIFHIFHIIIEFRSMPTVINNSFPHIILIYQKLINVWSTPAIIPNPHIKTLQYPNSNTRPALNIQKSPYSPSTHFSHVCPNTLSRASCLSTSLSRAKKRAVADIDRSHEIARLERRESLAVA